MQPFWQVALTAIALLIAYRVGFNRGTRYWVEPGDIQRRLWTRGPAAKPTQLPVQSDLADVGDDIPEPAERVPSVKFGDGQDLFVRAVIAAAQSDCEFDRGRGHGLATLGRDARARYMNRATLAVTAALDVIEGKTDA